MDVPATPGAVVIPIGSYTRISDDDKDEDGQLTREGVTRQETDNRKLAEDLSAQMGVTLDIVRFYDDNDITAANPRVTRPDFEQMLKDLASGVIMGIVFYHPTRVARQALDAARVCTLFEQNPKLIGRSVHGGTNLATDEGRAMFMMLAVMGGIEVANTRRLVTRKNKDNAEKGRNHGGKRPFGWEDDRKKLRQWEADLLKKAILDIPKGKTISMVRKEWIEAGVKATAEGKRQIGDATVLSRVINPRVCGYRQYMSAADRRENTNPWLPDLVIYKDGNPVIGDWERVVTPDEWKACVATLEVRRGRRSNHDFSRLHAKYLLSGIARCGECGSKMYGKPDNRNKGVHRYVCPEREGGCGGIKRVGQPLDELVEELLLKSAREEIGGAEKDDIDDTVYDARIRELREEVKDVMARRKPDHPKRISTAVAMDLVNDLEQEINELTYKARALTAEKVRRQQEAPAMLQEWESYTIDMKRAELRQHMNAVIINRTRRGARFDPGCIEIVWAA
jgi:site-specific DNA recombinase